MSHNQPGCDDEAVTVISAHRTSQGVVQYRRWPGGWISVELLDGTADVLAWVPGRTRAALLSGSDEGTRG
jgi:hypothetical protein